MAIAIVIGYMPREFVETLIKMIQKTTDIDKAHDNDVLAPIVRLMTTRAWISDGWDHLTQLPIVDGAKIERPTVNVDTFGFGNGVKGAILRRAEAGTLTMGYVYRLNLDKCAKGATWSNVEALIGPIASQDGNPLLGPLYTGELILRHGHPLYPKASHQC